MNAHANHVVPVNAECFAASIAVSTDQPQSLRVGPRAHPITPPAPVAQVDARTWAVASSSPANPPHIVRLLVPEHPELPGAYTCSDCLGFQFHGHCRHTEAVRATLTPDAAPRPFLCITCGQFPAMGEGLYCPHCALRLRPEALDGEDAAFPGAEENDAILAAPEPPGSLLDRYPGLPLRAQPLVLIAGERAKANGRIAAAAVTDGWDDLRPAEQPNVLDSLYD